MINLTHEFTKLGLYVMLVQLRYFSTISIISIIPQAPADMANASLAIMIYEETKRLHLDQVNTNENDI